MIKRKIELRRQGMQFSFLMQQFVSERILARFARCVFLRVTLGAPRPRFKAVHAWNEVSETVSSTQGSS
jgi:hypothetical protein